MSAAEAAALADQAGAPARARRAYGARRRVSAWPLPTDFRQPRVRSHGQAVSGRGGNR
ncbi:MAG: hypothetical protein OXP69_24075 [Spirochaetaceae bacterium]|nr:hypothetical protein [Spirochaetaceae bacterium]